MSSILISVLLIVEVLAAFLLIVVILAQKSKDQGLGMAFGGGMGESLFGSRAGNVLTRMTVTLAAVFMITTIVLGILFAKGTHGSGSVMEKADREIPVAPVAPLAAPAPLTAPMTPEQGSAPLTMDETPVAPAEAASAPIALQMNEGGKLEPVEETAVAPEQAPVAPAAEAEAPQD